MRFSYRTLLFVLILLAIVPATAQDDGIEIIGGDEDALRQFIRFLIAADLSLELVPPDVYVGQGLTNALFEVPMPEDADLVGSLDFPAEDGTYSISDRVMYETSLTPLAVATFYAENLGDEFQRPPSDVSPSGGLIIETAPQYEHYCYKGSEGILFLLVMPSQEGSHVTLYIGNAQNAERSCITAPVETQSPNPIERLPSLNSPEGAQVSIGYQMPLSSVSEGGAFVEATIAATIVTDSLTAKELVEFYSEQVTAEGWSITYTHAVADSGSITFTRTEPNGLWGGLITIVRNPTAENEFHANLGVYLVEEEAPPED